MSCDKLDECEALNDGSASCDCLFYTVQKFIISAGVSTEY